LTLDNIPSRDRRGLWQIKSR